MAKNVLGECFSIFTGS